MTDTDEIAVSILGSGLAIVAAICFLDLIIAMTEPRPVINEVGLDDGDLYRAVSQCIPYDLTFEQELACYQAIYGGD